MKRVAIVLSLIAALGLALAAAGLAGHTNGSTSAKPVKLTVWAYWSPGTHELKSFNKLIAEYDRNHPEVELSVVGGISDNKIVAAIRSGTAPEVVTSGNSYNVG